MKAFVKQLRRFMSDEQGLETIEYAVMTALIVAALVTAITALSGAVQTRFGKVQTTVSGLQ
jgi:Flp pilus assembly pilin Flp